MIFNSKGVFSLFFYGRSARYEQFPFLLISHAKITNHLLALGSFWRNFPIYVTGKEHPGLHLQEFHTHYYH